MLKKMMIPSTELQSWLQERATFNISAAGPVNGDELVEEQIRQQLASYLPPSSSSTTSSSVERPPSRSHSKKRDQKENYPISLTFHSVGSLPSPANLLCCPICGEDVDNLVVETASVSASAYDESATRAGMLLSNLRSTDKITSVSCHLDRCQKRRRSFEEQVFAHSRRRDNTAHLLLNSLGAITSFSQRAKRWSAEIEKHQKAVKLFFQDVELLRMQHVSNPNAREQEQINQDDDDSLIIARDSNLFDEFLGREVELFETGTRLTQEQEMLNEKAKNVVRNLELPCPMREKCISCVSHARSSRTPNTSRAGTPIDDRHDSHVSSAVNESRVDRGYITHSDVKDHAVACWEVCFRIEKAVGQFEAFSSGGAAQLLAGKSNSSNSGTQLKCPVSSGQATLWSILSQAAPSLVIRSTNAPQHYLDKCAAELSSGEDMLDTLFEASGLDFDTPTEQQTIMRQREMELRNASPARPRHVRFLDHNASQIEREEPMLRLVFVRSFDNEVVDGSMPLWKCWWLDFNVFVL